MTIKRPSLLFYCQHSLGMGHLKRALNLAAALSVKFNVIFLNGGRFPEDLPPPTDIEIIHLPPIGMDHDNQLFSQDHRYSLEEARIRRSQLILKALHAYNPDIIMIELFPFGRKKFAGEILPLLKSVRRSAPQNQPLILCSLRDIVVNARKDQIRHDNRARWLIDRYFDAVLVHSDPEIARLEESFKPSRPLKSSVFYTGFVLPASRPVEKSNSQPKILVSAGGGIVGAPLFHAAVTAHKTLWNSHRLPMTLVGGPFLPEAEWDELNKLAHNYPGLTLYRSVPNLNELFASHSASISQSGYNTIMDILSSNIPALVIPFAEGQEDEQTSRALKLSGLGLLRMLNAGELNGNRLALEIESLLKFLPSSANINLSGAQTTVSVIEKILTQQKHSLKLPDGEITGEYCV